MTAPIGLFSFETAPGQFFHYTDGDYDIASGGVLFVAEVLRLGSLRLTGSPETQKVSLETRVALPPVKSFLKSPRDFVCRLTVRTLDHDTGGDPVAYLSGNILDVAVEGSWAKLSVETMAGLVRKPGLRRHYQRTCPLALYGSSCKAPVQEEPALSLALVGGEWILRTNNILSVFDRQQFTSGLLLWESEGSLYRRHLKALKPANTGDARDHVAEFPGPGPDAGPISDIRVQKGCLRTEETCATWHDNIKNFGGFTSIPNEAPARQYSVYY